MNDPAAVAAEASRHLIDTYCEVFPIAHSSYACRIPALLHICILLPLTTIMPRDPLIGLVGKPSSGIPRSTMAVR